MFNYYIEKRKFDEEWALLKKQYKDAGMSDKAISEVRKIDLKEFNSRRRYRTHTQPLQSCFLSDVNEGSEEKYLSKCKALAISDIYFEMSCPQWIEYIENKHLYERLKHLSKGQLDVLTYFIEGYTHKQIAVIFGVSRQAISNRIARIKKILTFY